MTDTDKLLSRFAGDSRNLRIADFIRDLGLAGGSQQIAEEIAAQGKLESRRPGDVIIKEGDADTDVYFLLLGEADLLVGNRLTTKLTAPCQVGEMAAIRPALRSASVQATAGSAWLRLPQDNLERLLFDHPEMWKSLARDLATRLAERTGLVRPRNRRSRLFVGSSAESVNLAQALRSKFLHNTDLVEVILWSEDVFGAGEGTLERLEEEVALSDFGVFILSADDVTRSRGVQSPSPRDNALFELAMFIGRLGRKRSLFARPMGVELKLPSDLDGITPIDFPADIGDEAAMGFVADRLRNRICDMGPA